MLISMYSMRLYEIVSHYAKCNQSSILCIDNTKWFYLDETTKQEVKKFYEDLIPEDEIGEVFSNCHTFYEFPSQTTAVDTANEWFPLLKFLPDENYFIEVQVINPSGSIPYTNYATPKPE